LRTERSEQGRNGERYFHGETRSNNRHASTTGGLFVGFSDDRGLEVVVWFGAAAFVFVPVVFIIWVSRRHQVADKSEDAPFDE
jgi:hypothetical protein